LRPFEKSIFPQQIYSVIKRAQTFSADRKLRCLTHKFETFCFIDNPLAYSVEDFRRGVDERHEERIGGGREKQNIFGI
jgi:hypothetical protein